MFDIGFWELCLIAVIALLVFGPEKLPGVARSAGQWAGRIRYFITNFKQDIDRELQLQEIRESVQQSDQNLHEIVEETKTTMSDLNKPIDFDTESNKVQANSTDGTTTAAEEKSTIPDNSKQNSLT